MYYDVSHPMWVRGLKLVCCNIPLRLLHVAPHVGAWIETTQPYRGIDALLGRTPCGCVD